MIRELVIYGLAPALVLLTWEYQRLADRVRTRRREDIRAALAIWWVQDHLRGSADVTSVETQPAVDTRGGVSTAGHNNNTRWIKQWARKKRAKRTATSRTAANTPDGKATRSATKSSKTTTNDRADSSRQMTSARTEPATGSSPDLVAGSNVPAPALPHAAAGTEPATGALCRSPVAGPIRQATSPTPDVTSSAFQPGGSGEAGAVVPEATAPATKAA